MSTTDAAPAWWVNALVYQVYVRSFVDSDGDGIGDLRGIRQRLPELAALGLDALWLNPCYPSPQADHGYDVADYFDIEPAYGDLAEFDALVADARSHGIKILMDVVPNHCSSQHAWFKAALAAGPGSPERERFYFRDGKGPDGAEPPNNWRSIFSGSAWSRVTEPDGSLGQWYLCLFAKEQPDLNWDHPDVPDMFDRMLRFWFDRGVEGFRADAVGVVGKAPGLPDDPHPTSGERAVGSENPYFLYRPEGHVAWRRWRRLIDDYEREHPGRSIVTVAEVYTPSRPDLMRQYVNVHEFHQTFAFDPMLAPWSAPQLRDAVVTTIEALAPDGLLPAWTLNNHDTQRSVTRYGRADATTFYSGDNLVSSTAPVDLELGTRRARAAALMLLSLPGCAYLYAGEELGLPEVLDIPAGARQDPIFLRTHGLDLGRDGCRVPLPWHTDASGSFGFSPASSDAHAWMPQPAGWGRFAADAQAADDASMLSLYRRAAAARRASADLASAAFEVVLADDVDLFAFRRGSTVVVVNTASSERTLPADLVGRRVVALSSVVGHDDPNTVPADAAIWLATS